MAWTVAIGVDTHKEAHVAVACDRLGRQLDACELPAGAGGYARLLEWAEGLGSPAFAIEGCGSYGAGLARFLQASGAAVFECERPRRRERRRGKSDLIDAALAARRLVAGEGLARPRGGGRREDLRLRLGSLRGTRLARAAQALRAGSDEERVLVGVLRRLARRVQQLEAELAELEAELEAIVSELVPELLAECGVGPVCAAQLVASSGDPARMRSEAAFAALAGTSPVDASSGRQRRHRLNRGGDRQLNRTLHVIALARVRHDRETAAYHERLLGSGKTDREARRCIKRALARHFYHRLSANSALTT